MWRISVFILAAFVASCAATAGKDRAIEEEYKEALQEIEDIEVDRAQLRAERESLKEKIRQTEQAVAAERDETEELQKRLEDIEKTLQRLEKEHKSPPHKGARQSSGEEVIEKRLPEPPKAGMRVEKSEPGKEVIEKYLRDSEFVAHGLVDTFGTGMDGSLVYIGFTIREVLKGDYTEAKVEFEQFPPSVSGGVKAFDLFKKHGHNYIICFKKGAEEGKYEYCGPRIDSPEIIANGANVAKVKECLKTAPPDTKEK